MCHPSGSSSRSGSVGGVGSAQSLLRSARWHEHGIYLRTDRDATRRNNLDDLPSAPRAVLDPDVVQEVDTSQILESDNTSANIDEAQEARVKDPPWFLARQWQTGEFEAENGGRPAQTDVTWTSSPMDRLVRGDAEEVLDPLHPLDARIEAEQNQGTSPAWNSERLEYLFGLTGARWNLRAEEYKGRGLDWYHFVPRGSVAALLLTCPNTSAVRAPARPPPVASRVPRRGHSVDKWPVR